MFEFFCKIATARVSTAERSYITVLFIFLFVPSSDAHFLFHYFLIRKPQCFCSSVHALFYCFCARRHLLGSLVFFNIFV